MKAIRPHLLRWRYGTMIFAVAAVVLALTLWWTDGAWEYGSMPTKGLFRAFLFASASIVCMGISIFISDKNRNE